jgi:uncharacterized protein YbaR (Trm112 family)
MAGEPLSRGRRFLLGAALGLPLLARHSALGSRRSTASAGSFDPEFTFSGARSPAPVEDERRTPDHVRGDEGGWAHALHAFRAAEAAVAAEEKRLAGAPFAQAEAGQAAYDALCETLEDALLALLACPAPDTPALSLKLAVADTHEIWSVNGGEAIPAALAEEARRLGAAGG